MSNATLKVTTGGKEYEALFTNITDQQVVDAIKVLRSKNASQLAPVHDEPPIAPEPPPLRIG